LTNEKIRDDFLVFTAGDCMDAGIRVVQSAITEMRIKYGIEQAIYHLRSAVNNRVAFLLDTFICKSRP